MSAAVGLAVPLIVLVGIGVNMAITLGRVADALEAIRDETRKAGRS